MEPERLQRTVAGRRLTRALVGGALLGIFAFVYLPWWGVLVAVVLGAAIGLAVPVPVAAPGHHVGPSRRQR